MNKRISFLLFVTLTIAANAALAREVKLGNIGTKGILATVPDEWAVGAQDKSMPNNTVILELSRGKTGAEEIMLVTVFQPPASWVEKKTPSILQIVTENARELGSRAVKKELKVEPFRAGLVEGFLFSATFEVPKEMDSKYRTEGMGSIGDLAVVFTVLTNSDRTGAKKAVLAIVGSLRAEMNSSERARFRRNIEE